MSTVVSRRRALASGVAAMCSLMAAKARAALGLPAGAKPAAAAEPAGGEAYRYDDDWQRVTMYCYDSEGMLLSVTEPAECETTMYRYDNA